MIPTVNIDTRSYEEIFDEAVKLIPKYCPEWNNLSEGDPGITLLSLFSWMTEMTLSRINRIPQKVYMALLDMLGFSIKPPQAATGIVRFLTDKGLEDGKVVIKKGTRIGSIDLNAEGLLFSANDTIVLRNNALEYCFNKDANVFKQIRVTDGVVDQFDLFETENAVEYMLYFSSQVFKTIVDTSTIVQISFEPNVEVFSVKDEIINYFVWEYWNGESWTQIKPLRVIEGEKQHDNVLYFPGPIPDLTSTTVNGKEGLWFRAMLVDIPENNRILDLYNIKLKVFSDTSGAPVEKLYRYSSSGFVSDVDTREPFKVFPESPQAGDCFYMSHETLFSKPGVKVYLCYTYSSDYLLNPNSRNVNKYVDFSYEYFNGKKWVPLKSENEFLDETNGFEKEGNVSFVVPKDFQKTVFSNENNYWIRIRISPKNYAYGGDYIKSEKDKKIVWGFDSNLLMPELDHISIKNAPFNQDFDDVIAYDNFEYHSLDYFTTPHDGKQALKIFDINQNLMPALYLGFSGTLAHGRMGMYIKINDAAKTITDDYLNNVFSYKQSVNSTDAGNNLSMEWQILTKTGWKECSVVDQTNMFSNSGFVDIMLKNDLEPQTMFGKEAAWIRVIKKNGSFEMTPHLENISINCVEVKNFVEYTNEMISYTNLDESLNRYRVTAGNLLKGVRICVNERRIPTREEIKVLRDEGIETPYVVDGDDVWVEYKEVPNFYNSGLLSRHFVVNYSENAIYFGDGINGVSPVSSGFQIKFISYSVGGGVVGNLSAHKLQYMTENHPHVIGCDNPFPCEGGSDIETLEDLRARASGLLRSLDRAVTTEDFEWLAREASPGVARAHCINNIDTPGEVKIVIVPRQTQVDYTKVTYPSRALMSTVKEFLNLRKVIGVKISIFPPYYRRFTVNVDVIFNESYFDRNAEKQKIVEALQIYYNPIYGSSTGEGWEFGKNITKSSISNEVEAIESVIKVLKVDIFDIDKDSFVDELTIGSSELPFITDVNVYDRIL